MAADDVMACARDVDAHGDDATATAATTAMTVQLPLRYPASMLLHVIDDDVTRRLLREEEQLRAERTRLLEELQRVQSQRDEQTRYNATAATEAAAHHVDSGAATAATTAQSSSSTVTMEELQQQKNSLYSELDTVTRARDAVVQAQQDVRAATTDVVSLSHEVNACTVLLRDEERALARLCGDANNNNNNKATGRRTAAATTSSSSVVVQQQQQRVRKCAAQLQEKTSQLHAAQATLQQRRATLQSSVAGGTYEVLRERTQALRTRIAALQQQQAVLAYARQQLRAHEASRRDAWRLQLQQQRDAVRAVEARLRELRTQRLPCTHFTYAEAQRPLLLGPGGATLQQLQIDYGVALCLDSVPAGHGFVLGGDAARAGCVRAVNAIVASGASTAAAAAAQQQQQQPHVDGDDNNSNDMDSQAVRSGEGDGGKSGGVDAYTASLPYELRDRRGIVGERGGNVVAIERATRARVRVDGDGVVRVSARTRVARDAAVQLVRVLLDEFTRGEVRFAPALYPLVVGRDGAVVQRVQRESGARHIHVDHARGRIVCSGNAAAVQRAVLAYTALLADEAQCASESVACDAATLRQLIANRGALVRAWEAATGARIACSDTRVTMTGTAAAVRAARERLAALLRRADARVALDARALDFVTSALVVVARDTTHTDDDKDTAAADAGDDAAGHMTATTAATTTTNAISLLRAVQRVTHCDVVTPLFVEGAVVLRGALVSVRAAEVLLQQLLRVNAFYAVRVPCPAALLRCAALRRTHLLAPLWSHTPRDDEDDDKDSDNGHDTKDNNDDEAAAAAAASRTHGTDDKHTELTATSSSSASSSSALSSPSSMPPLWTFVDVDEAASLVRVSAADAHDAAVAAARLRARVAALTARHVRSIRGVAASALSALMAQRGARLRELQARTHTQCVLVRGAHDAEVQLCSVDGDAQALRAGVRAVCEVMNVPVPVE